MAYKGKVDLKTAHPNSPFAGPQLSFGAQPAPNSQAKSDAELIAWAAKQPLIKRGTVEESLMRWLESDEPTAGKPDGQSKPKPIKG